MRWLLIHPGPNFSVADVYDGWLEALRGLGEDVMEYRLDRRLTFFDQALFADDLTDEEGRQAIHKAIPRERAIELAAESILAFCHQWWPDVVLCTSAFFVPPFTLKVIRARKHKIVMLMTESPYQDDFQLNVAQYADLTLLNDPVNLEKYRQVGPAEYMPHAHRPSVHHPPTKPTQKAWDLAFVGSGFPSRIAFFEQMNLAGLSVRFAGPWMGLPEGSPLRDYGDLTPSGCMANTETAALYRHSRAGINFYRREAEDAHAGEGWACGPREIEMAACGLWFMRDPRPESDGLFPMLPSFTSPDEASGLLRWALARPEDAAEAAGKAREAVADRTFENNAKALLRMIEKG